MKLAAYALAGLLAGAGVYGALNGASPALTLAAGIGVGILLVLASRARRGDR